MYIYINIYNILHYAQVFVCFNTSNLAVFWNKVLWLTINFPLQHPRDVYIRHKKFSWASIENRNTSWNITLFCNSEPSIIRRFFTHSNHCSNQCDWHYGKFSISKFQFIFNLYSLGGFLWWMNFFFFLQDTIRRFINLIYVLWDLN